MQTENQKNKQNDSTFVLQFLKALSFADPQRLPEVLSFFCEAYLLHTEDEVFDETEYRVEWQSNINYIADLAKQVKRFDKKTVQDDLDKVIIMLEKGGSYVQS